MLMGPNDRAIGHLSIIAGAARDGIQDTSPNTITAPPDKAVSYSSDCQIQSATADQILESHNKSGNKDLSVLLRDFARL